MIYNFELFCESLGLLNSLEEIANKIIKQFALNNNKVCTIKTKYLGNDIEIYCNGNVKSIGDGLAKKSHATLTYNNNNYKYKITGNLSYQNLMHELKHMDRDIRKNKKNDYFQLLSFSGRKSAIDYDNLLKKGEFRDGVLFASKKNLLLLDILYYQDQNEFESHFHTMYYDIQREIKSKWYLNKENGPTKEEKRKIINDYLNNSSIYLVYKSIYKNKFNLLDFFKNKKDIDFFISHFNEIFEILKNKGIGSQITFVKGELFKKYWKHKLKKIFTKNHTDNNEKIKQINYQINKSIQKNYKKIYRLYSLFNI